MKSAQPFMICREYRTQVARERAIKIIHRDHGYNRFYGAVTRWGSPHNKRKSWRLAFEYDATLEEKKVVLHNIEEFTWNEAVAQWVEPDQLVDLDAVEVTGEFT